MSSFKVIIFTLFCLITASSVLAQNPNTNSDKHIQEILGNMDHTYNGVRSEVIKFIHSKNIGFDEDMILASEKEFQEFKLQEEARLKHFISTRNRFHYKSGKKHETHLETLIYKINSEIVDLVKQKTELDLLISEQTKSLQNQLPYQKNYKQIEELKESLVKERALSIELVKRSHEIQLIQKEFKLYKEHTWVYNEKWKTASNYFAIAGTLSGFVSGLIYDYFFITEHVANHEITMPAVIGLAITAFFVTLSSTIIGVVGGIAIPRLLEITAELADTLRPSHNLTKISTNTLEKLVKEKKLAFKNREELNLMKSMLNHLFCDANLMKSEEILKSNPAVPTLIRIGKSKVKVRIEEFEKSGFDDAIQTEHQQMLEHEKDMAVPAKVISH